MRKVFISKNLEKRDPLQQLLNQLDCQVIAQSLLRHRPVAFDRPILADWLFFNRPESVQFFMDRMGNIPQNYQLAALGLNTAKSLESFGFELQFIGQGGLQEIATSFLALASNQGVIFVQSRKSKDNIMPLVSEKVAASELIVYENLPRADLQIPPCDIYIFTSPLNVTSYFDRFLFPDNTQVISTDHFTQAKLNTYGIDSICTAVQLQDEDLFKLLKEIILEV